jgi:hypothetical protein
MTSVTLGSIKQAGLARAAATNGAINAVINGAIQLFLLRGHGPIALSADAISTDEHTVLGSAVLLAVSLAMILTTVTHLTLKGPKRPFFPAILWLTIKHGFFAFGVLVAGAVLWQRAAGTVVVSVPVAVLVLGLIAGLVAAAVTYMTTLASLEPSQ